MLNLWLKSRHIVGRRVVLLGLALVSGKGDSAGLPGVPFWKPRGVP